MPAGGIKRHLATLLLAWKGEEEGRGGDLMDPCHITSRRLSRCLFWHQPFPSLALLSHSSFRVDMREERKKKEFLNQRPTKAVQQAQH